ncbi:UDP-N-acetylglucosamine--N-acetylmuramyl-(pentapeptide) pyrophosphoryl-undecaprenol N-acetylglucosamine transferase [Ferrimicrobium acidiphilum]|uniref:UDP-N-acetylglucosamine--N-acetylmuramyl- (pentapeptide) pyrophosphoryl-undecaprenol N-acetylglucosamine transferase n=1 Tax=Ferrimicrobium acidiphilum TaxID=121039 RepID=UPI0023F107DA|nr:UDP-N-acetylglucosamine--N-acetylmuramyl-(pentapeptide) pyrophosphoryl-undecaprenol N-acetylglucosamine transferase [Ferrimicrobium acidiphilum]
MSRVVWVVAGGTAGHIHAGLSVIEAFDDDVHPILITTDREVDYEVTEGLNLEVIRVRGAGLPHGARGIFAAVVTNVVAISHNLAQLRSLARPDLVISFGGFHTPLVSLLARVRGARSYLLEQNAALTRSNRLVGLWSSRIFLAWPISLPKSWLRRAAVVGNPPRRELLKLTDRQAVRASLGFDADDILVVVTSGSLGARSVNVATLEAAELLASDDHVRIVHSMGSKNALGEPRSQTGTGMANKHYHSLGYDSGLYRYLMAADLVVARAGASTLTEIALFGVPSILIPLPLSPNDHQNRNADIFVRAGASVVIDDDNLTGQVLATALGELIADETRRVRMGLAAKRLAHPDAARLIWEEMVQA